MITKFDLFNLINKTFDYSNNDNIREDIINRVWEVISDDINEQIQNEKTDDELIIEFLSDYTGVNDFNVNEFNNEFRDLAERMISKGWTK